jgi:IS5 family transposase
MKVHIPERQLLMFETQFSDILNREHELLRAARLIDWDNIHDTLSAYYSLRGRQGKSIRLMVGIHILKHRYNCSDERAVEMLHENAYWQCFCGFNSFPAWTDYGSHIPGEVSESNRHGRDERDKK